MQQGYPISDEVQEVSRTDGKTYTVQYFERAEFEFHPENQAPYNVLISLLGQSSYREKYPQGAPNQAPNTQANSVLFPQTGRRLGGKFLKYWQEHGGLMQQGYPISDEFQEKSELNGKTYTVQYFERAVFEAHLENQPPYDILLAQLGALRYGELYDPTAWLRNRVVAQRTTEPDSNDQDLMALKGVIGNAHIVALGESTHGSHEFFTMKQRILQFLVKEMGFTVFALEDGWAEAQEVNSYLQTGDHHTDEIAKAMQGLNHYRFPWGTTEMLDIFGWIQSYNERQDLVPNRLSAVNLQGFDMQDAGPAISYVLDFLQKVDPQTVDQAAKQYACYGSMEAYRHRMALDKSACQDSIQHVYDALEENEARYQARSSAQEFDEALHAAQTAVQSAAFWGGPSENPVDHLRDQYMAENVEWIVQHAGPNSRIIISAHNAHVETSPIQISPRVKSMGQYLREQYGEDMRVLGLDFYGGVINAYGPSASESDPPEPVTVAEPSESSYEQYFHSASIPIFLLDLQAVSQDSPAINWLGSQRKIWSIGGHYAPPNSGTYTLSLTAAFDALIYVDRLTPSLLLR
ncbi:MAG: erythromycin esterase family protein [Chloroflexota bacterium]